MTEPNSAFEGLVRDFKAAALNAGARNMEATVNPAYDSANVQLHYDLMNAAEKALLDAYAGVMAERDALKLALEIAQVRFSSIMATLSLEARCLPDYFIALSDAILCDNEDCGHTIIEHAKDGECTVCACEKFLMIQPEVEE